MSSEKDLTTLERSKDNPRFLLDHAAKIVHLGFHEGECRYLQTDSSISRAQAPDFRSQWVLKWLLKKLKEPAANRIGQKFADLKAETHPHHRDQSLLYDGKSWAFLLALMSSISPPVLCSILIERRFTELLITAWKSFTQVQTSVADTSPFQASGEDPRHDDFRSVKRRRLSPPISDSSNVSPGVSPCDHINVWLKQYLKVLDKYAQVIRPLAKPQPDSFPRLSRAVPAAWARNIGEATQLLGCVLQASINVSDSTTSSHLTELQSIPAINWLSLWHEYASSSSSEKQKSNKVFCESCLNSCFRLRMISQRALNNSIKRDLLKAIEQQVVLNVVLPLRAYFVEKFSTQWKSTPNCITWKHIHPLYDQMVLHLGEALVTEEIMGVAFTSFQHPSYASQLYNMAARIISRDDSRRQQWERPWLNALVTTLMHLAFPQHMYRLVEGGDGILEANNADLPYHTRSDTPWPEDLLQAILDENTELSPTVSPYVLMSVLRWRGEEMPIPLLVNLVKIDVDAFVPHNKTPNCKECLYLLFERVENLQGLIHEDFETVVHQVILPVLQSFARSRDIGEFVKIWTPRLQNAFRARLTNHQDVFDTVFVYDDENLFLGFEDTIREHAPQGFGTEILQLTIENLRTISQRIGPTTDILANVAVLISILRAKPNTFASVDIKTQLAALRLVTVEALQRQSDYQGQRWRLWMLLRALEHSVDLRADSQLQKLVLQQSPKLWDQFKEVNADYTIPYQLMELMQAFAFIIRHNSILEAQYMAAVNHLREAINYLKATDASGVATGCTWLTLSWNGKLSDLTSMGKLVCGYIGCIIREDGANLAQIKSVLYSEVQLAAYQATSLKHLEDGSLGMLFRDLLAAFNRSNCSSLFGCYVDVYIDHPADEVPSVLQNLSLEGFHKKAAKQLTDVLVTKLLREPASDDRANKASDIALLSKVVQTYLVSIGLPQNFLKLVDISKLIDVDAVAEVQDCSPTKENSLMVMRACLTSMAEILPARMQQIQPHELHSELVHRIETWCKEVIAASVDSSMRDSELLLLDALIGCVGHGFSFWDTSISAYEEAYLKAVLAVTEIPRYTRILLYLSGSGGSLAQVLSRGRQSAYNGEEQLCSTIEKLREKLHIGRVSLADNSTGQVNEVSYQKTSMADFQDVLESLPEKAALSNSERLTHDWQLLVSQHMNDNLQASLRIGNMIMMLDQSTIERTSHVRTKLCQIAGLENAATSKSTQHLVLQLEICRTVLVYHPEIIGQVTIDSLLKSLAIVSSSAFELCSSATDVNHETAKPSTTAIYDRLILIFSILLSRYRRRLNGRSHLVAPVLQNLMRCLFYTPERKYIYQNRASTKQKEAFRKSLPAWLLLERTEALPPSCADKLTRILSSICNPTTASARSAHKSKKRKSEASLELNDETKRAKRLASQYMQYVLIEYARSTLDGVMVAEARERLRPGLFAILDSLDRDLTKTMNTSMDPSSRAIFKGLYDDWLKFGKWDQS